MSTSETNPRITFKEVLDLGVAEGTLKRRLIKREWATVVVGTGRNGKPVREILLDSLPAELQKRYVEQSVSCMQVNVGEQLVTMPLPCALCWKSNYFKTSSVLCGNVHRVFHRIRWKMFQRS